jgi:MFS family permease
MSRSVSFLVTATAMCVLAVALSTNFGLAATIVQERAPSPLRGRISAIFGLSFFGLQPLAGLLTPGFADLVGIPTALMVSSIIFGIGALIVLNRAGHECDAPPGAISPCAEPQVAPAPIA